MKYRYLLFYSFVGLILFSKIAITLIERSSTVHHGHQVAALQKEKNALAKQKQTLTQQLAQQTALTDISQNLNAEEFIAISSPIVITQTKQLASTAVSAVGLE